jgi:hypothetical protein
MVSKSNGYKTPKTIKYSSICNVEYRNGKPTNRAARIRDQILIIFSRSAYIIVYLLLITYPILLKNSLYLEVGEIWPNFFLKKKPFQKMKECISDYRLELI